MRSLKTKRRYLPLILSSAVVIVVIVCSLLFNHFFLSQTITDHSSPESVTDGLPTDNAKDKTDKQKAAHTAPPLQPRHISIDSIGVNANVISVGVLADGAMDAPKTAWDVGWYDGSSQPSDDAGALLLDGHVNNTLGTPGVFYDLHKLTSGDTIELETGNHKTYTYQIQKVEQIPTDNVDMTKMMRSINPDSQGLNIITCGGDYNYKKSTFDDRILVYSVRI